MATHSQGAGKRRGVCYIDESHSRAIDELWRRSGVRSRNQYLAAILADTIASKSLVRITSPQVIREPKPEYGSETRKPK